MQKELDERLKYAASMVRKGARVADVGCDHAYLSIYLIKNKIAESVVASDLRKGPLASAKANIEKENLTDRIDTVLSDGLDEIDGEKTDDVVICGMGGILICDIISRAKWLKNAEKNIVIQPMTDADIVRKYLYGEGFEIVREKCAKAENRLYSVFNAVYTGNKTEVSELFAIVGKIPENMGNTEKLYIDFQKEILKKRQKGLLKAKNKDETKLNELEKLIDGLRKITEEN